MPKGLKKAFVRGVENDQLKMVHTHARIAPKKTTSTDEEKGQK
jgi:hypothetical protein